MKHGPIALIDQFMPVVIIAPRSDPNYRKLVSNIEEVRHSDHPQYRWGPPTTVVEYK
jgi:glucosamine 6-phosphate synthetase-like amidotransferase/phosphosugar isomerase protein